LRSNPIDPDPRVEKAATALGNYGYTVRILGWDRSASLKEFDSAYQVPIQRLGFQADYGTGLQNFPALLRWQWGLFHWLILHREEIDIIHACDFDTVIPALFMKLLWGKKVIYDIFDFYADHLRATPGWVKSLIRFVDRRCVGWADSVILVDNARINQIGGTKSKKFVVINNTPPDVLPKLLKNKNNSQSDLFRIAYVGLLQIERGLIEILNVMQKHPEWTLTLAGYGGDEIRIKERASEMENVKWYGRVSYERALELSFQADVLFATYDPDIPNHQYASPNKLFEAMMLGKPIIVARNTNIDHIVEDEDCGLIIKYGDTDQLDQALISLFENSKRRDLMGSNGRKAYEEKYAWKVMESRLIEMYSSF
jgi:glycosyltransferase involved in cell wall biosynthesis